MGRDINEVRKRLNARKKHRHPMKSNERLERKSDHHTSQSFRDTEVTFHPLFNKQGFLFRAMIAACLFLGAGILFKSESEKLTPVKQYVTGVMEQEFQFAAVKEWYEGKFGNPVALFPDGTDDVDTAGDAPLYALPANGKVLEDFQANGKGIMVETVLSTEVEAINAGVITYAGEKEGIGNTVIIQHADGSESWYGMLESVDVSLYDFVKTKDKLGSVTNSEDGKTGTFYFAIKQNESFVDPLQVVPIE